MHQHPSEETLPLVKEIFRSYLKEKNQRQTPERYRVLEEIYTMEGHSDAEDLYDRLKSSGERVSRATVYNTLDILVECGLVQRHQFGQNQYYYERAYAYQQHDHLICESCGLVIEFCDPRILEIQKMIERIHGVVISDHSLHFRGRCLDEKACAERQSGGSKIKSS